MRALWASTGVSYRAATRLQAGARRGKITVKVMSACEMIAGKTKPAYPYAWRLSGTAGCESGSVCSLNRGYSIVGRANVDRFPKRKRYVRVRQSTPPLYKDTTKPVNTFQHIS